MALLCEKKPGEDKLFRITAYNVFKTQGK